MNSQQGYAHLWSQHSASWTVNCMITVAQNSVSWTVHIYDPTTTALSQLDCAHLWSHHYSTQPAGLCTSVIIALSQLDCAHLWSQHHSPLLGRLCSCMITALSQLDCAHLWSQYLSTQPSSLCMFSVTIIWEHFNTACTFVHTCRPWLLVPLLQLFLYYHLKNKRNNG